MFRKALMAFVATTAIALAPTDASARGGFGGGGFHGGGFHGGFARGGWHGGGWRGGFGPALAGGLLAGAVIGGIASSAYAWEPGYYGPAYSGYGYYGGYGNGCPQPGEGDYYNCGAYAVPGYGGYRPTYYYGYGPGW
jgi:hypothetical protein